MLSGIVRYRDLTDCGIYPTGPEYWPKSRNIRYFATLGACGCREVRVFARFLYPDVKVWSMLSRPPQNRPHGASVKALKPEGQCDQLIAAVCYVV